MEKLLTVTIPSYNVEKYLPETLPTFLDESILEKIEILIVNDGSKDNTLEIAEQYRAQYPDTIRVINKENGGHGSTINTGIQHASGKYFKVVDGDDWVDTAAFCRFVQQLEDTDADMVVSPFARIDDQTKRCLEITEYRELESGRIYPLDVFVPIAKEKRFAMHSLTIRTEILKTIRPISEHCFYVDMEYIVFPLKYAKTVTLIDTPVYQYRVGNASQSVAMSNLHKNRNMHLHVLKTIIAYRDELNGAAKEIAEKQILGLCEKQFVILCTMPDYAVSKRETMEFLQYIKSAIPELYKTIPGKKNKLLILSNGVLFPVVHKMYRAKIG